MRPVGASLLFLMLSFVCNDANFGRLPQVGFGGSPDEEGETSLDAMIIDGVRHKHSHSRKL